MADLNGTWLGTYWQQGVASRFEAVFVQSGNALSGSILDDNYLGEAQITGEVIGRSVSFTKRYLITSPAPIHYIGTVSENEDYIQGKWNIGRRFSGKWEARRSGENLMDELNNRIQQQIPQPTG
jgi:frataxin-like iron-binding protein CyaY